jgi:hypothetical protein
MSLYDQPDVGPIDSVEDGERDEERERADTLERALLDVHDMVRILWRGGGVGTKSRWQAVEALIRASRTVLTDASTGTEIRAAHWAGETADAAASGDYTRAATMAESMALAVRDLRRV